MIKLKNHEWFREKWKPSFSFGLWHFESGLSFNFFGLWIKLPIYPKNDPKDLCDRWGFSYDYGALHYSFGGQGKIIWMPWDWGCNVEYTVQNEMGDFVNPSDEYKPPYADNRRVFHAPYTYILKNGTVQNRMATFYVEYREWRWRIFNKLPFRFGPSIKNKSISVSFDDEVGERTGSWKGGTIGCSYLMLPNERPVQTLKRMEKERKF